MNKIILIILLITTCISSAQEKRKFKSFSLPLVGGLSTAIEKMNADGFEIMESHPEEDNARADIILKKPDGSVIIYYIGSECYAQNYCNFLDLYCSKTLFDKIKSEVKSDADYKFVDTKVTDLGICDIYLDGDENTYPFSRIELTSYKKNGLNKYLISFKNSPGYNKNLSKWKFQRRYTQYE